MLGFKIFTGYGPDCYTDAENILIFLKKILKYKSLHTGFFTARRVL